ncbi:MAG: hypothetical protein AVDCRST_MAG89-1541 [uncultured Gemmatimonadetes bacterium]|uniref:Uncharacterized protein n=1 Tax=uncultured Gemmatimonadota bacterium TaxID=203437 RepID=A0A6J4KZM0_9BACT|nr:MAG: hypothetical protein AVDCRST_MAG89-1541 [uncultured Gemmatimonadota bacterium]
MFGTVFGSRANGCPGLAVGQESAWLLDFHADREAAWRVL